MSEDEIIDKINYMINNWHRNVVEIDIQWIQGLLDLYQKEKDSNQWLLKAFDESRNNNIELAKDYYKLQKELDQEKEKNKNLIKQLQEQNTEIQDISKQLREKEQEDIKMRAKFVLSLDDYILKDKIKAKIEKLKKLYDESKGLQGDVNILYHIGYLKELLEEN